MPINSRRRTLIASVFAIGLVTTAAIQSPKFPTGVFNGSGGDTNIALDFDTTGVVTAYVDNQAFSSSPFSAKADTLIFGAVTGPEGYSCAGSGRYLWALSENRMTFTRINDDCQIRIDTLTGLSWTRRS
jgi:hypothetical protein